MENLIIRCQCFEAVSYPSNYLSEGSRDNMHILSDTILT